MFTKVPSYGPYRTLELRDPYMKGEDVYALQTALGGFDAGAADGVLGPRTSRAIIRAQTSFGLTIDGKAGGLTQRALAMGIAESMTAEYRLPRGALRGQLEHESGFRLGNYSAPRPDGSFDAGVAQRNSQFTPPAEGFDVPDSIDRLAGHTLDFFDRFDGIRDKRRRWALAMGAWNAPAFASYLAREAGAARVALNTTRKPSATQRETFEAYVAHVTTYLEA